jgi:phosphoglycolate phosphatase
MKFKLALFDFDGTLADSAVWFLQQMNVLAGEFKFRRIEDADFEKLRSYSSRQIIKHMGIPMWKMPALMSRMRKAAAQHNGEIRLFPGVDSMLAELEKSGICAGIVSSNAEANIRSVLGPANTARIQHFSCGASLFGKAVKLRGVLRRSGFAAKDAIYIGDEIRDAVSAREVGMAFGAVEWGFTAAEALRQEKPAVNFLRVEDIPRLLR